MTNPEMVAQLQGLLAEVQWSGPKVQVPNHRQESTCPSCQAPFPGPHATDCKLAVALKLQPATEPDLAALQSELDQVTQELERVREEAKRGLDA
jgi:DNA repair exonuclease SbcCD ATPase subunit